ncbi:MAG: LD-carboxypeptidase [Paramuribaculum sp.]|nr:LD-carboxypeptidase [Paramuribaculum sp.]
MTESRSIIIPPFLQPADRVAIVSPSGAVRDSFIDGAAAALAAMGFSPVVMPHARGSYGSYAASAEDRFSDFSIALLSRDIKAILCSRGGYGAVHLVEKLSRMPLRENAKWIIGFSDISALHALWQFKGMASILGPMGRHLTENPSDHPSVTALRDMLSGSPRAVEAPAHTFNRCGEASGIVRGGNLAVLSSLQSTPFCAFIPGSILVIEDINEPIYRLERMLWELRLQGVLAEISGLVCGAFTGTGADRNYASAEEMIRDMTAPYGYPVAFGMPVGHIPENMPIMLGSRAQLSVSERGAHLTFFQE